MRKTLAMLVALVLLAGVATAALAETWHLYAKKDGVKVYEEPDKNSRVLRKLKKNERVFINSKEGSWYSIYLEEDDGQNIGWVQSKYLTAESECQHEWGKWKVVLEPTCTEEGLKQRFCKLCGAMQERDIEKTGHEFGKWKVIEEATCTEKGERERTCKVCGYEQTEAIPKTGHEFGKWKVIEEATCTEEGERERTCKVCGYEETEEIPKREHEYGPWEVEEEPTCTKEGLRVRTCEVCGHEQEQAIEKVPHEFGSWEVVTEATDHSAGVRERTCEVCGYTDKESFDPDGTLRRGMKGDDVRKMQQQLVDQGYLAAGGADGTFGSSTEKAVMEFQRDQGLQVDGVAWPQTIKRMTHDFGDWQTFIPLTRTSAGQYYRVCKDCGYRQSKNVELTPVLTRSQRGEDVRTVQQMLNDLGYNAGTADGIYGPKLDNAFSAFAVANATMFMPSKVVPENLDALVNKWIAAQPSVNWMGEGSVGASANLVLTVKPADGEDPSGELVTFDWTLTNMGVKTCHYEAILLAFGDNPSFLSDNYVVTIDGKDLRANGLDIASGSFTVARSWNSQQTTLNFCALGTVQNEGTRWTSNAVAFPKEEAEAVTEDATETKDENAGA